MKDHEHATQNEPDTEPSQDKVAKKAYAIYLKEGRPQGRDVQNWLETEAKTPTLDRRTMHTWRRISENGSGSHWS